MSDCCYVRVERENVEYQLGYQFTDDRWKEFCEMNGDAFQDYMDEVLVDNAEHLSIIYNESYDPIEYWTNDNYEEDLMKEKLKEELMDKGRKKFIKKIENYYLQAKYNPRTPIGKKFANALYDENFKLINCKTN